MDAGTAHPFGALLRRYRLAAGLSQEQLAERAGLSARAVSALEQRGHLARARRTGWPRPFAGATSRLLKKSLDGNFGASARRILNLRAAPKPADSGPWRTFSAAC